MAYIDDLIASVPDPSLRASLTVEVAKLKSTAKFGLVFERHIPENAVVPGRAPAPNSLVILRHDPEHVYTVERLDLLGAELREHGSNRTIQAPVSELLVLAPVGDPIYPALTSCGTIERNPDRPFHAVINGENYHALQLLTFMYEGQVDCIYIDPPYNTGARDWKYNNRYVDSNDTWRHSKWLSMMEKRLSLSKRLLKVDGVLVIAIDEHEVHHLAMLLEDLFPEYSRYMVSIVTNARGSTGTGHFGIIEEQAMFVVPKVGDALIEPRERFIPGFSSSIASDIEDLLGKIVRAIPKLSDTMHAASSPLTPEELSTLEDLRAEYDGPCDDANPNSEKSAVYWRGAVRTGQATSFRTQRKKQFYALYLNPDTKDIEHVGEPLLNTADTGNLAAPDWTEVDGLIPIWPIDEEGRERVWCYEPERMRQEIQRGNIKVGRFNPARGTYAVNVRRVRKTTSRLRERTVWWERSYDSGSNGTNVLKALLGESGTFPFPKSIYTVRDVLATVVGSRPNALILDFFAGSGTTFHAVCLLNAIDNGARRTVLVTNNEVDEDTHASLVARGLVPGDPEYEAHGIFEHVTKPRATAVITGVQPNGASVPGRLKWAGGRPLAQGFDENIEFFRLDYLDKDSVALGQTFDAINPCLWLMSGARGARSLPALQARGWAIAEGGTYAILTDDTKIHPFAAALAVEPEISQVFLVTDSHEAYAEMVEILGGRWSTSMLYTDYLRNFKIRGGMFE